MMYHSLSRAGIKQGLDMQRSCQMVAKCYGHISVLDTGRVCMTGLVALLKRSIRNEQMKMETPKLQTAANVLAFCIKRQAKEAELHNQHKEYKNAKRNVLRYFHLINKVDQRKKYDYKYFKGVRSLHCSTSITL